MKSVLVTGAEGFIGSHIVDSLLKKGYHVIAVDIIPFKSAKNLSNAKKNKHLEYHQLDISKDGRLDIFFENKIEKIYHYASVVGVQKYLSYPEEVIQVNILGILNVAKLAKKHGTSVLFASTSEVYGRNPKVPWSEDDDRVLGSTSLERWTYSSSKATAEHLLMAVLKGTSVRWTIVRYFNVYGPRQNANFVVSANLKNYILKKALICHNDGEQTRCYSFIDDVIDATIKLAEEKRNGVFNIGSDVEVTINELLYEINKLTERKEEIKEIDTQIEFGEGFEDIPRRVPNVEKINREINWKAKTTLSNGLRQTYNWISKNEWWLVKEV
tara:strand:- start:25325 stop:26305 length:981 start_codon:yes stop_codon:yes gene_type:complete